MLGYTRVHAYVSECQSTCVRAYVCVCVRVCVWGAHPVVGPGLGTLAPVHRPNHWARARVPGVGGGRVCVCVCGGGGVDVDDDDAGGYRDDDDSIYGDGDGI